MKLPIQILFRDMNPSPAIEERVHLLANRLERYSEHIMSCHVVIESQHHHHHKGLIYTVTISLTLPGTELVASRESSENHAHEDVYVAIRDSFDAIKRQLQDHNSIHHDQVRHREKLARDWKSDHNDDHEPS